MNWIAVFGIVCIISLVLPVIVILYNRFYKHRSLAALLIYYTLTALYNMMYLNILPVSTSIRSGFGILTNYLDTPLIMMVLLFFCPTRQKLQKVYYLGVLFIVYEIFITFLYGFKRTSVVYILGPGIVLTLFYVGYLFVRQVKFTILHGKNAGRSIMLASILFAYFCFGLIYYFFYIQNTTFIEDTYLLYYISTTTSSVLMSIGLVLANKRIKKLDDLRVTRRELQLFFNS